MKLKVIREVDVRRAVVFFQNLQLTRSKEFPRLAPEELPELGLFFRWHCEALEWVNGDQFELYAAHRNFRQHDCSDRRACGCRGKRFAAFMATWKQWLRKNAPMNMPRQRVSL